MVADLARRDAEKLREKGVTLSLEECVRLNALALAVENTASVRQPYLLPRVAIIGDFVLREPSLAQQVWFDDFSRLASAMDNVTMLCVSAAAYSTPAANLPDVGDVEACLELIRATYKRVEDVGVRALAAALKYIASGIDHTEGEFAPRPRGEKAPKIEEGQDISVALGVLLDGAVVSLGISLEEAQKLTRAQMDDLRAEKLDAEMLKKGLSQNALEEARRKNKYREYLRYYDTLRRRANVPS
jgi:hypothetical protein